MSFFPSIPFGFEMVSRKWSKMYNMFALNEDSIKFSSWLSMHMLKWAKVCILYLLTSYWVRRVPIGLLKIWRDLHSKTKFRFPSSLTSWRKIIHHIECWVKLLMLQMQIAIEIPWHSVEGFEQEISKKAASFGSSESNTVL